MIENLRKYTVLIVVLFALVIVGFVLMDTSSMQQGSRRGIPVLKIAGKTYTNGEVSKLGNSGYQLTQALSQSGDWQLFSFLYSLAGNASSEEEAHENFFTSRILLRAAKEEFGIYPGDEEIDTMIRQFRLFTSQDGAFSQEQYRNFIERGLGRLGLIEGDLRELASDILVHRKLMEILGSGLSTDPDIVAKQAAINGQRINAKLARIDIDPIKATIDPTEEEIKTYWETVQDAFKTEEKRKFTYLIATPSPQQLPEEIPALPEDADDKGKAEHARKVAEREVIVIENQRLSRIEVGKQVDEFLYKLESQENLSFDQLAEESGFKLETTEMIAKSEAPPELQVALRASSMEGNAADALFRLNVTSDPASKITDFAIGENQWMVARVVEIEPSRVKTFDEAREQARGQLFADQAAAALAKAAAEAHEKIRTALAEDKTFEEAAKEAGIETEIVALTEVTQSTQVEVEKAPMGLFNAAKFITPGQLAEPVIETDRAFIVLVEKREIVKDPDADSMLKTRVNEANQSNNVNAFVSWLSEKTEAASVQQINRRK
jgi:hypothetical protein